MRAVRQPARAPQRIDIDDLDFADVQPHGAVGFERLQQLVGGLPRDREHRREFFLRQPYPQAARAGAAYHRDARNIATHLVGIPSIVFAVGPLFVVAEAAFFAGLRSDVRRVIDERAGPVRGRARDAHV